MFGEDDSDGVRAPSPWDGFMPTPPSEPGSLEAHKPLRNGVPKLAPEIEEVRLIHRSSRVTSLCSSLRSGQR